MFFTELKDRKLYFDGQSSYDPQNILKLQSKYQIHWVDYITPTIEQYNRLSPPNKQLQIKQQCDPLDLSWNIPEKYKTLDVVEYLFDKHMELTSDMSSVDIDERDARLVYELSLYKKHDKIEMLRTMIYISETLEEHNIVYGIGRGSCVSSYVLYVLGIHDVDSFMYDLDINEFFHD